MVSMATGYLLSIIQSVSFTQNKM